MTVLVPGKNSPHSRPLRDMAGEYLTWAEHGSPDNYNNSLTSLSSAGRSFPSRDHLRSAHEDRGVVLQQAPNCLNNSTRMQGGNNSSGRGDSSPARGRFIEDLLAAESSLCALDRYKALIRLMSHIKRRIAAAGIVLAQLHDPESWEGSGAGNYELLRQVLLVGESLARLGTAEFGERSNSSRAINTKDYATLLQHFLEAHGPVFSIEFISALPPALQDEAFIVRTLLQTRCESNSLIFGQLVKQIGAEPTTGSLSTVVYNSSALTSNPVTIASSNPTMSTAVDAKAEVTEKRSARFGIIGAASLLGIWVLKGRLLGGGRSSQDSSIIRYEPADSSGGRQRGGRTLGGGEGALGMVERLVESERSAERAAMQHISACAEQLQRAKRNSELLTHDWRLGTLRLGGGIHPPGYEPMDTSTCSLKGYLARIGDETTGNKRWSNQDSDM